MLVEVSLSCFVVHNFFEPQPIKDADVFLLHMIIHDWSDKYCIQILKNLRKVAVVGKTTLVIVEAIMDHACEVKEIYMPVKETGAVVKPAPAPLLPNFGGANSPPYAIDIVVSI